MTLITGCNGFIGHNLMKAMPDAIGLDNTDRGHTHNWINADLKDYNDIFWKLRDLGVKKVIHLAAIPSVPDSYKDPIRTYTNNVTASINLIKICKILGVEKFIFASSSSVLGTSPYGHSKKIIEEVLHHTQMPYTALRFFNVYGPGQRQNVLQIMHDCIKSDRELTIFGEGDTTRDFTHVDNVVTAVIKAMSPQYNGRILEVGTGDPHSLNEVFAILKSRLNPNYNKLKYAPSRIGDIKYSKADTFLGKIEITPFEIGIEKWLTQIS
jgi:UDP-glucose 4-epimerase